MPSPRGRQQKLLLDFIHFSKENKENISRKYIVEVARERQSSSPVAPLNNKQIKKKK
jgi:hypothetical protein